MLSLQEVQYNNKWHIVGFYSSVIHCDISAHSGRSYWNCLTDGSARQSAKDV